MRMGLGQSPLTIPFLSLPHTSLYLSKHLQYVWETEKSVYLATFGSPAPHLIHSPKDVWMP